jgi:molybdate transport system substrate-binding protein
MRTHGGKGGMRRAASLWVAALALAMLAGVAKADQLQVLSAGSVHAVLPQLTQEFELDTRNYVPVTFANVGELTARIETGAPVDVMILTPAALLRLADKGLMRVGTRLDLGRVGVGVAVPVGATAPDVSTPEALKAALLSARTVIYADPTKASSAIHFAKVIEQLGIAAQVKAKAHIVPNGIVGMQALARETGPGLAIGITQITEILPNPGVKLAGPLPGDLQHYTTYSVALGAHSTNYWSGYAYMAWLSSPKGQAAFAAAGFQVP